MKGAKLFLPASFLLAVVLFIFSCGEYPEIPYEDRDVGELDPSDQSSPSGTSSDGASGTSSGGTSGSSSGGNSGGSSGAAGSSSSGAVEPAMLIWDLKTHGGNVTTGGRWFEGNDRGDGGGSSTDFNCSYGGTCQWSSDGSINMSFVPYPIGTNSYLGYADAHFFWKADSTPMPQVWENRIGLCVEYALTASPTNISSNIQIEVGEAYKYDNYLISMPKTGGDVTKKLFKFSDFKRDGWNNDVESTLNEAKQISRGIQFQTTLRSSTSSARGTSTITLKSISMVSDASQCVTAPAASSPLWDFSYGGSVETGGGWFDFNDESEKGESKTDFHCTFDDGCQWIDANEGKINFEFKTSAGGGPQYHAFAGVGFSWSWDNSKPWSEIWGSHTGLCVEYALEKDPDVVLDIRINSGNAFNYNVFKFDLPATTSLTKRFINFNQFEQEVWGPSDVGTLAEAKQKSTGINFQGNVKKSSTISGATAALTLKSLRWDSCN